MSDRIAWAVRRLGVEPHHHVLEAGCGHGVALSLIAPVLTSGTLTAIDRSPKMIAAARKRTAAHPQIRFLQTELADADLGDARYDRILAIHLPVLLRGDPHEEAALLRRHLAPHGELHVSFQPHDPARFLDQADRIDRALAAEGFFCQGIAVGDVGGGVVVSVIAT